VRLTVGNSLLSDRSGDVVELVGAVNASGEGRGSESEDKGGGTHFD
jgi:hypothetical protein